MPADAPADGTGAVERFGYASGIAPMLWVLVGLSAIELCVAHLLVALLLGRWAALALSTLSVGGMVAIAWLIRSLRRFPVEVDAGALRMSVGALRPIAVPRDAVARVRLDFTGAEARMPGVLRLSLIAHPNVLVELARPIGQGRRIVHAIAHRLDEPGRFAAALGMTGYGR